MRVYSVLPVFLILGANAYFLSQDHLGVSDLSTDEMASIRGFACKCTVDWHSIRVSTDFWFTGECEHGPQYDAADCGYPGGSPYPCCEISDTCTKTPTPNNGECTCFVCGLYTRA